MPIQISPETFAQSADEAVRRKARDGERMMATPTEAGTPAPTASELGLKRFAYQDPSARELVASYIEEKGGLGAVADDKKFRPGQRYFRSFMGQLGKGIFGYKPEEVA